MANIRLRLEDANRELEWDGDVYVETHGGFLWVYVVGGTVTLFPEHRVRRVVVTK